ncbi:MAG TPA: STAS domain-containing protein [Streptosporangiaceae bacterium]|nr:STAS domain-containing protein [Streptosporangiaceae bacterium]
MELLNVSAPAREPDGGALCAVVSLAGRVGIGDCAWFRELLELQTAQEPDRIVIDLSQLSSLDWWAALILLWAGRVVHRRGGTLVLASPQPAVARVLASAGAEQVVSVYDSLGRASADRTVKTVKTVNQYAAR